MANRFYQSGLAQPGFHKRKLAGIYVGAADPKLAAIYAETNRQFWDKTEYKRGEKLNPSDPKDKPYIKVWMTIYTQVKASPPTTKGDALAKIAADETKKSIDATKAGNTKKAADHAVKADEIAVAALKEMTPPVPGAQALARLTEKTFRESKLWATKKPHGRFFGWGIRKDGLIFTKETDSETEIVDWFDGLADPQGAHAGTLYALYWDEQFKNAEGVIVPVREFTPVISATDLSNALDASEAPPPRWGGGGGGAALGLGLAGALGLLALIAKH